MIDLKNFSRISAVIMLTMLASAVYAQDNVLNLYSSRHYQTDDALSANSAKLTGLKINRIEAGEDPLIERLRNEGARSPADLLLTVDAGRMWRAEQMGLFHPVTSILLECRMSAIMRAPNNF